MLFLKVLDFCSRFCLLLFVADQAKKQVGCKHQTRPVHSDGGKYFQALPWKGSSSFKPSSCASGELHCCFFRLGWPLEEMMKCE